MDGNVDVYDMFIWQQNVTDGPLQSSAESIIEPPAKTTKSVSADQEADAVEPVTEISLDVEPEYVVMQNLFLRQNLYQSCRLKMLRLMMFCLEAQMLPRSMCGLPAVLKILLV